MREPASFLVIANKKIMGTPRKGEKSVIQNNSRF